MPEDLPARGEPAKKKQIAKPSVTNRQEPPHGSLSRYTRKVDPCRCSECTTAMTAYRKAWRAKKRTEEGKSPLPKRPPAMVWLDSTDFSHVVRCERCDKNYGTWFDKRDAQAFQEQHRYMHEVAQEPKWSWHAWSKERLLKNPGGRPPLDDKPLCTYSDCSEDAHAKGLCMKHYQRALRGGLYE